MPGNWFREDIGARLAVRTAQVAAVASTARTFGRGLMPRTTTGQALATGLTGSVNYGLVVTGQSLLWAGASALAPVLMPRDLAEGGAEAMAAYRGRVRLLAYGTYVATGAAARPLERLVPEVPGESAGRALARSFLQRARAISVGGLVATAAGDVAYSALDRTDLSPRTRRAVSTGVVLAAGSALATALVHRENNRRSEATGEAPPPLAAREVGIGAATAVGLIALGRAETLAARGIGRLLPDAVPTPAATAVGHVVCLGALGFGVWQGIELLYRSVEGAGTAMESLHELPPSSPHVSGGPASGIDWSIMSREGRRFAALPLSRDEIAEVMGSAEADPVRVFVPLAGAGTPEERARLAVDEMVALGAFERPLVVLCSPTGTGYVNYVMAEAVEFLTRGNCAIVATQYSLRPSFLSLDRVDVGRANAIALLSAVQAHLATIPEDSRPRLVLFGESLGAHTAQDIGLHRGVAGITGYGIDRALFIGTPDESGWAKQWRADPAVADPDGVVVEVDSYEEYSRLPDHAREAARFVLISHDEDPITKFGPELAIRRPPWLDPDLSKRPTGVPPEMEWRPLATFFVLVADLMNSMTVVPGQFGADGHDYRADLAQFVRTTFDLPCSPEELARIESALRARELRIAESRLLADEIAAARERATSALTGWGLEGSFADRLIDDEVSRQRRSRGGPGAAGPESDGSPSVTSGGGPAQGSG